MSHMSQPLSHFCLLVSDFVSVSHPCLSLFHGGGIEKFARVPRLHVLREHGCLNFSLSQCLETSPLAVNLERRGFWSTSTDQRLKKRPNCAIAPPQAPIFLISCFHGLRDKEYTSPFFAPAPALPYCFKCLSQVYYSKSLNMCSMSQANTRRHNADVITETLNTGTHGDNINLDYKKFDL